MNATDIELRIIFQSNNNRTIQLIDFLILIHAA